MLRMVFILSIINLAFGGTDATFKRFQAIRTGQQKIIPSGGLASVSPLFSFKVIFSLQYFSLDYTPVVGLVGFQSPITYDFNFNLTITEVTEPGFTIHLKIYGDMRVTMFSVSYIAIENPSTTTFIQKYSECFSTSLLNKSSGPRFQAKTMNTIFNQGKLLIISFFTGFKLTNIAKTEAYLKLQSYQILFSKTIETSFFTTKNNTVSDICYTVLIFNLLNAKEVFIYRNGIMGRQSVSNKTDLSLVDFGAKMNQFRDQDRMFFAISGFFLSQKAPRNFLIDTQSSYNDLTLNYMASEQTYEVIISYFFINERQNCVSSIYDYETLQCLNSLQCISLGRIIYMDICTACHFSCLNCTVPGSNGCNSCSSTRNLTTSSCLCSFGLVEVGLSQCFSCGTLIQNCLQCTVFEYSIRCTNCGLYPIINDKCQCPVGYQYLNSTLCINSFGCLTYNIISSILARCVTCNTSANFNSLVNSTFQCQCQQGYHFNSGNCLQLCGDGILTLSQQCDDNNTINGDGCSNLCIQQVNWTCNISVNPSRCTLINITNITNIKINYTLRTLYIRRVVNSNTMQISIQLLSTNNQSFSNLELRQKITHNIPIQNYDLSYSNGIIIMKFHYLQSLEGKNYSINFIANNSLPNQLISLNIKAVGMNSMLSFDQYYSHTFVLTILVLIVVVGSIIVLFLSLMSNHMIGVQVIQTYQTIFFLMAFICKTPACLSSFHFLKFSNGYNLYKGSDYSRLYVSNFSIASLDIEKQFLLNQNLMILILIILCVVIGFLKAVRNYFSKSLQIIKNNPVQQFQIFKKMWKINKIIRFISDRILIVFFSLSMFSVIFSFANQLKDNPSYISNYSNSVNLFVGLLSISVVAYILISIISTITIISPIFNFELVKQTYPPFYFFYQLILISFISTYYSSTTMIIIIFILVGLNIIFLLYLKPYRLKKHNFALVYHQIIIISSLGLFTFVSLSQYRPESETSYLFMAYLLIILMISALFWDTYRLWIWRIEASQFLTILTVEQDYDIYLTNKQQNKQLKIKEQIMQIKDKNIKILQRNNIDESKEAKNQRKRIRQRFSAY